MNQLRKFFRGYARVVVIWLDKISGGRITANHITLLNVAGHVPVVWLIASNQLFWAGVVLLFFGLLDVFDGELARHQKKASPSGMVLDASTDRIKEIALYSAAAYWLSQYGYAGWEWLAAAVMGAIISISYLKAKAEVALAVRDKLADHHKLNRFFHEGLVPFDLRSLIFGVGLLSGQLFAAITIVAVLAAFSIAERHLNILKGLS